jgi:hypothetical protein
MPGGIIFAIKETSRIAVYCSSVRISHSTSFSFGMKQQSVNAMASHSCPTKCYAYSRVARNHMFVTNRSTRECILNNGRTISSRFARERLLRYWDTVVPTWYTIYCKASRRTRIEFVSFIKHVMLLAIRGPSNLLNIYNDNKTTSYGGSTRQNAVQASTHHGQLAHHVQLDVYNSRTRKLS